MDKDFDALKETIAEREKELIQLKQEYREKQTAGLKAAMEARREADRLVQLELKNLGYSTKDNWTRFYGNPIFVRTLSMVRQYISQMPNVRET